MFSNIQFNSRGKPKGLLLRHIDLLLWQIASVLLYIHYNLVAYYQVTNCIWHDKKFTQVHLWMFSNIQLKLTCIPAASATCDFEDGSDCGYLNNWQMNTSLDWIMTSGQNAPGTGQPMYDATFGNDTGMFLYYFIDSVIERQLYTCSTRGTTVHQITW